VDGSHLSDNHYAILRLVFTSFVLLAIVASIFAEDFLCAAPDAEDSAFAAATAVLEGTFGAGPRGCARGHVH
jgi:hypothetical protein